MTSDGAMRVSVTIGAQRQEEGTGEISFETGRMAKQASGAVVVRQGETMVLATAVAGAVRDVDFLPLTVDVEERMYATGKIPGSFFKREGRPGEKATLTARMIDRPLRPLFPKGWRYDTQLVAIPMSVDHVHPYDILAMNGASAAVMISDIPFPTPVGAVRIGKVDGDFVINPREQDLLAPDSDEADPRSDLDLVVAGTEEAILMVEAGANEVPEAEILDALDIAHAEIKKLCALQRELAQKVGKEKKEFTPIAVEQPLLEQIRSSHGGALDEATQVEDKLARQEATKAVETAVLEQYVRQAREVDHPRAHRGREEASGRARRERDPRHHDRGRGDAADTRLGPVHARADAGPQRGLAGHVEGGDAPRHARARDEKVLLAPLQLPAFLGRRGRQDGRRQAPRHRPRRARRASAGADGALDRIVPLLDPRRLGHPRVQRLLLHGLGVRLLAGPDGRRRPDQAPGSGNRDGPDQRGR